MRTDDEQQCLSMKTVLTAETTTFSKSSGGIPLPLPAVGLSMPASEAMRNLLKNRKRLKGRMP